MISIAGFIFLLVCVFGGYIAAGGKMDIILKALPFEFAIIGGAAFGALLMANSISEVKHIFGGFGKILKGSKYKRQDYMELLSLLFWLVRLAQTKGPMAIEPHIEKPEESAAFQKFPTILKDHHTVAIICDYLRMVGMNADDPHQIEDVMARELKKMKEEELHSAHALQSVADAMIGSALVGTFLGVLLAYGLVGPFASRLKTVIEEEAKYYEVIRAVLVAHLHGNAPQVAVETGRKMVPTDLMPSFQEVEESLQELKF